MKNYNIYTEGMAKSMQDKLFFFDEYILTKHLNIVDFGCADGALIKYISDTYPNIDIKYYGIDNCPTMIDRAKTNLENSHIHCEFFNSIAEYKSKKYDNNNNLLLLSSVIHEVEHYCNIIAKREFWDFVYKSNFNTIVIRDMFGDTSHHFKDIAAEVRKIENSISLPQLQDFEKLYGKIDNSVSLSHFLLKYRFLDNWSRELPENYFPFIIGGDPLIVVNNSYFPIFYERYTLPFTKERVKEDFDIDFVLDTHYKLILNKYA